MPSNKLVVGIDSGETKTNVVVMTTDGELVGRAAASARLKGIDDATEALNGLVTGIVDNPDVVHASVCLSGLHLDTEASLFRQRLRRFEWARNGLDIEPQPLAVLRSATLNPNAVAVSCGVGSTAIATNDRGEKWTFASMGSLSGDWGGGIGLGKAALWHAARALDRRGPKTALTEEIEYEFDMPVEAVIAALHRGEMPEVELGRMAPAVFYAADRGDRVAQQLVERQASEVVAYVRAGTDALSLTGEVDVVLADSILAARNPSLLDQVEEGVLQVLPEAQILPAHGEAVVGATLLALQSAGADRAAIERAAAAF